MRNQQDILVWKLDKDLSRACLALGKIYNIAMKVYCPEAKHAMSSIHRKDVDKIVETLQEYFDNGKETVTIEKKVYDTLQKNNLDLMEKLEKAKKTLKIYAVRTNWDPNYTDSFCCLDGWKIAQDCLKEIEE